MNIENVQHLKLREFTPDDKCSEAKAYLKTYPDKRVSIMDFRKDILLDSYKRILNDRSNT